MIERIITIFVGRAVLGGGGYYAYQRPNATKTSATANLQTTTVQTGTLVAAVAASGALASPQTGNVTWQVTRVVGQVNVKVGDVVTANTDPLTQLVIARHRAAFEITWINYYQSNDKRNGVWPTSARSTSPPFHRLHSGQAQALTSVEDVSTFPCNTFF